MVYVSVILPVYYDQKASDRNQVDERTRSMEMSSSALTPEFTHRVLFGNRFGVVASLVSLWMFTLLLGVGLSPKSDGYFDDARMRYQGLIGLTRNIQRG